MKVLDWKADLWLRCRDEYQEGGSSSLSPLPSTSSSLNIYRSPVDICRPLRHPHHDYLYTYAYTSPLSPPSHQISHSHTTSAFLGSFNACLLISEL